MQHAHTLIAELVADREVGCVEICAHADKVNKHFIARKRSAKTYHLHLSFARRYCSKAGRKEGERVVNELILTFPQALAYSASRTSKQVQHLHSIFVSTYAILFLGTPHNGSSTASFASIGRRLVDAVVPSKVLDSEGQLLDALKDDSEVLQNITDMFVPLMKRFRIYFFWEQEKTDFGATRGYVRS